MDSTQLAVYLVLAGLLMGASIAFVVAAVQLRGQLRKIGTLPDLNKKLIFLQVIIQKTFHSI